MTNDPIIAIISTAARRGSCRLGLRLPDLIIANDGTPKTCKGGNEADRDECSTNSLHFMHKNKARSHMITRADNQNEHRPASAACIVYTSLFTRIL